jgi:hypothetical protein
MPAAHCVVQDCNNIARPGISVHKSPDHKSDDPPKFEAKSVIRQWSCLNLNPLKAVL